MIFNHLQTRPACDCHYIAPELRAAGQVCNKCAANALGQPRQVGVGQTGVSAGVSLSWLAIAAIAAAALYFSRSPRSRRRRRR